MGARLHQFSTREAELPETHRESRVVRGKLGIPEPKISEPKPEPEPEPEPELEPEPEPDPQHQTSIPGYSDETTSSGETTYVWRHIIVLKDSIITLTCARSHIDACMQVFEMMISSRRWWRGL
jgi:hypothetical protein